MSRRRAGRVQLVGLAAGCLLPIVLATSMYRLQFWVPEGRTYHGYLLGNGQGRGDLGVEAGESRWQLLVTAPGDCDPQCRQLVYLARQINIGLGRDAGRVSHALASPAAGESPENAGFFAGYPQLRRFSLDVRRYRLTVPEPQRAWLWIVDPHGNLVLRYEADVRGQDVLRDLQHLLKLSNIG